MSNYTRKVLTVEELAIMSNRTQDNIRDLCRKGEIKGIKQGKEWRIPEEEAYRFAGVKTDIKTMERELRIKELEGQVNTLEVQVRAFKSLATTMSQLLIG